MRSIKPWIVSVALCVASACAGRGVAPQGGAAVAVPAEDAQSSTDLGEEEAPLSGDDCSPHAELCSEEAFQSAHRGVSSQRGEWVALGEVRAYLALPPDGRAPLPGIVFLHSAYGHTKNVQLWTERLAESGYATLAPDLFNGGRASSDAEARQLRDQANGRAADIERTIGAAFEYLAEEPRVASQRRALVGWSWGGAWATYMATRLQGVDAVVAYAGSALDSDEMAEKVDAPLLLFRGADDEKFSARQTATVLGRFEQSGRQLEVVQVAGGHAFGDPTRSDYSAQGDQTAFRWLRSFLQTHLER